MGSNKLKNIFAFSIPLFILHTLEEVLFRLWNTDAFSLTASNLLHIPPVSVYWLGQVLLYTFLASLLYLPRFGTHKAPLVLLGFGFLFEFEHSIVALQSGQYEPGLVTGTLLALYGLFFWFSLIKKQ